MKTSTKTFLIFCAVAAVLLGACLISVLAIQPEKVENRIVETVDPSTGATTTKTAPTIDGDSIVHVGEDAQAGTYRAEEKVDGLCYWMKSKDAEGEFIIDNDIPSGGRPQVTLKKGQWFTTRGCPDWVLKQEPKPKAKTSSPEAIKKSVPTTPTAKATKTSSVKSYSNCADLRKDHPAGVPRGHAAYRASLDRDKDGYACESN